jgi:ubiquinone biosynthesis protein
MLRARRWYAARAMASLISAVKDIDRLRQITTVLARHGFGELLARMGLGGAAVAEVGGEKRKVSFAERMRLAIEELGPSFVKLGQIVSTRPDLIPPDVITELKKLQDSVPPMSIEDVRQTIQETLGAPAEEIYRGFDDRPLASASIGQVHRARLAVDEEGEVEVVVKVQRPRIRQTIERDLDLLYFLARVVERAIPESKLYSPVGLVSEFDRAIMAELDYTVEADNAERFARNFLGNPVVRFPRVFRGATGKRVLTLEFFPGKKIYAAVTDGASGAAIADHALAIIAQMIFEDGFFHADPHPGNVLIMGPNEEPVIGMLDLGLVGRLTPEMRDKLIDLMVAAVRAEPAGLADALLSVGRPRGKVDLDAFRAEVARLSERYLGRPIKEIEVAAMIRDLVDGAVRFDIEMPTEMLMVGKALMTVEGVGKEIHPDLDVWSTLRPYFLKLVWKRYHPERLAREALRVLAQLGTATTNLPRQINAILEDLHRGRLEVKVKDDGLPAAGDRLGRRIYASVTVAAFTLAGSLLVALGENELLGIVLLALAGAQLLFHLWGDLRRKM